MLILNAKSVLASTTWIALKEFVKLGVITSRINVNLMIYIMTSVWSVKKIIFWERMWSSVNLYRMGFLVVTFMRININARNALKIIIFLSLQIVRKLQIKPWLIVSIIKINKFVKNVHPIISSTPALINVNCPAFLHVKFTIMFNLVKNVKRIMVL